MGGVVLEPEDKQDKAYRISFTRCSIERCRGKSKRRQGPAKEADEAAEDAGDPPG